jgi:hypothetical protein
MFQVRRIRLRSSETYHTFRMRVGKRQRKTSLFGNMDVGETDYAGASASFLHAVRNGPVARLER